MAVWYAGRLVGLVLCAVVMVVVALLIVAFAIVSGVAGAAQGLAESASAKRQGRL